MATTHGKFYKNTAWQYGLQVIKYIFPLLTLPYLTRVLEPDGYALYSYVISLMTFAQVFIEFGFTLSGTKRISEATTTAEKNRIIGAVTQARIILCVLAGLVVMLVASALSMTQNYLPYVFLAFIGIAEKAFLPDFIFQGHEQMGPLTTRYFVSKGTSTALTFVFVHSFADIYWIPALDILSGAIALIWSFLSARKLFGTGITFVSLQETLEEIKTSGLYCFSSMSAAIFTSFTTLFIGFAISDAAQISYWSIAMTAVSAVQSLYTPIINSLYPHILVTKDYRFVKKLILLSIAPVTIGSICFALLHNVLMSIIGGSAYMAGSWVFIAVTPVVFSSFYSMLLGWPIMGTYGLIKEVTATAVVSGIFCILALVIGYFIIEMNLYYVCAIRCITEFIMAGLRGIFSFKVLRKEAA